MAATVLLSNSLRQAVHTHCASVHQSAKLVAALLRVAGVTAGLAESNGSLVYDSRHLQADCKDPGSASEPYAWYLSMGYLFYLYRTVPLEICGVSFEAGQMTSMSPGYHSLQH